MASASRSRFGMRRALKAWGGVAVAAGASASAWLYLQGATNHASARSKPQPQHPWFPRVVANNACVSVKRGRVSHYTTSQYAANNPMEDAHQEQLRLHGGTPGALFGVFDGHSGGAASRFCRDELFTFLQFLHQESDGSLLDGDVFLVADEVFLSQALREQRPDDGLSGACATVCHVQQDTIRAANAGDCRAVIGRRVVSETGETSWLAVPLTTDHEILSNPAEKLRLQRQHPDEGDVVRRNRVKGGLQPTRGLGDGKYKRMDYFLAAPQRLRRRYKRWKPPYTTAAADLVEYQMQEGDEFLVMATDGLFQDLSSQQVVQLLGGYIEDGVVAEGEDPTRNASVLLTRDALLAAAKYAWASDDDDELLQRVVRLDPSVRRRYHDDVTVTCVFFDRVASFPSDQPAHRTQCPPPASLLRWLRDTEQELHTLIEEHEK